MKNTCARLGGALLLWGGFVAAASSFYPSLALERDVRQHLIANGVPKASILELDGDQTHLSGEKRLLVAVKLRGDNTVYSYYRDRNGTIRLESTLTDQHETLSR